MQAVQQRHAGQRPRLVRAADAEASCKASIFCLSVSLFLTWQAGTVVEVSAYSEFDVASAVPLAQITGVTSTTALSACDVFD